MVTEDVLARLNALEECNTALVRKLRRRGRIELIAVAIVVGAASLGLASPEAGIVERIEVLEGMLSGKSAITLSNETGSKVVKLTPEGILLKGPDNRAAKLRPNLLRMDGPDGVAELFFHKGEPAVGLEPHGAEYFRFLKYGMLRY